MWLYATLSIDLKTAKEIKKNCSAQPLNEEEINLSLFKQNKNFNVFQTFAYACLVCLGQKVNPHEKTVVAAQFLFVFNRVLFVSFKCGGGGAQRGDENGQC